MDVAFRAEEKTLVHGKGAPAEAAPAGSGTK
jgi:hypothetical protein